MPLPSIHIGRASACQCAGWLPAWPWLGGIQVFPPRDRQLQAWREGRIGAADLALALRQLPAAQAAGLVPERCQQALEAGLRPVQLPLLIDVLDSDADRRAKLSWRQAVTHQVSQTCAAYFDEHQASWQPERRQGLYAFWPRHLAARPRHRPC